MSHKKGQSSSQSGGLHDSRKSYIPPWVQDEHNHDQQRPAPMPSPPRSESSNPSSAEGQSVLSDEVIAHLTERIKKEVEHFMQSSDADVVVDHHKAKPIRNSDFVTRSSNTGSRRVTYGSYSPSLSPVRSAPSSPIAERRVVQSRSSEGQRDKNSGRNRRPIAPPPSSDTELNNTDQKWGDLFDSDCNPTPRLGQFLRGLANYIIEEFHPRNSSVITPAKMAAFYTEHTLENEVYPLISIFKSQEYENLSNLYQELECQHHLVQEEPFMRPAIPGLTPIGFAHWMTQWILAYPDQEASRFEKIVSMPIDADVGTVDGKTERLPQQISRYLLPSKENREARQVLVTAISFFLMDDLETLGEQKSLIASSLVPLSRRASSSAQSKGYRPTNPSNLNTTGGNLSESFNSPPKKLPTFIPSSYTTPSERPSISPPDVLALPDQSKNVIGDVDGENNHSVREEIEEDSIRTPVEKSIDSDQGGYLPMIIFKILLSINLAIITEAWSNMLLDHLELLEADHQFHQRLTVFHSWRVRILFASLRKETSSLLSGCFLEVKEFIDGPHHKLPNDIKRLIWRCHCGHISTENFKEIKNGAVIDFANELMESGYVNHAQISNRSGGRISFLNMKIGNLFLGMTRRIGRMRLSLLPLFAKPVTARAIATNCLPPRTCHWLHLCLKKKPYATELKPLHVCKDDNQNDFTDATFFRALRIAYSKQRTWRERLIFKLRRIEFVKFEACPADYVDHIIPNEIPPSTDEYDFIPPPPPKMVPPISINHMMHLFNDCSSACASNVNKFYLERIPRKKAEPLLFRPERIDGNTGWGLHFVEILNTSLAVTVMFFVSLMTGLVFAIAWSVLKMDVQGAFGVAAYITSLATLAVMTWQMWEYIPRES